MLIGRSTSLSDFILDMIQSMACPGSHLKPSLVGKAGWVLTDMNQALRSRQESLAGISQPINISLSDAPPSCGRRQVAKILEQGNIANMLARKAIKCRLRCLFM